MDRHNQKEPLTQKRIERDVRRREDIGIDFFIFLPISALLIGVIIWVVLTAPFAAGFYRLLLLILSLPLLVLLDVRLCMKWLSGRRAMREIRSGDYIIRCDALNRKSKETRSSALMARRTSMASRTRNSERLCFHFYGFDSFVLKERRSPDGHALASEYWFDRYNAGDRFYLIIQKKTRRILEIYDAEAYELDASLLEKQEDRDDPDVS